MSMSPDAIQLQRAVFTVSDGVQPVKRMVYSAMRQKTLCHVEIGNIVLEFSDEAEVKAIARILLGITSPVEIPHRPGGGAGLT